MGFQRGQSMDQENNKNPAILGRADSNLTLGFMSHSKEASWDKAVIIGRANLAELKDTFPKSANPAALVYRDEAGKAGFVYFDTQQPNAQDEALKIIGRNTTHLITPPLYKR